MERKVEQVEAEAESAEILEGEMAGMGAGGLEAQFKELEAQQQGTEADFALMELKAKLGMGGAPAPPQIGEAE